MRSALAAFMALMVAAQVVTAQVVSAPAGRAERPTVEALEDALTPPPKNVTRGIRFGDNAPVKPVSATLPALADRLYGWHTHTTATHAQGAAEAPTRRNSAHATAPALTMITTAQVMKTELAKDRS